MRRVIRGFRFVLIAILVAITLTSNASSESSSLDEPKPKIKVIYAGRLIDATSERVRTNVSIIVENDRIREVRDGKAPVPRDAELIDLSDSTVMPGLIDCHTHLTWQLDRGKTFKDFTLVQNADLAIHATVYARRTLLAGFTTVRDLGAPDFIDVSLRDAIKAGTVPGPRMYVSGYFLSITGGHGDLSAGFREGLLPEPDFRSGVVNSPEDGIRAVRYMIKYGADQIKITATGGVLSVGDVHLGEQLTLPEMKAIVETAHMLGKKVAAHAHAVEGVKDALRAGVDSIEHGTYLDDEAIALFKEHGAYLVPTFFPGKWVEAKAKAGWYPPVIAAKAAGLGPEKHKSFDKAYRGKIKIAFGTDAGVYPHGDNGKEFEYMVEAGMSPIEAILCATRNAADLLGQSANLGTVESGRYADIIAVKGDPLSDIRLLQKISFVMKEGVIYKRDGKVAIP